MNIKQDHTKRINNVILYIENNLSKDLSIGDLAELACFSKFHFSRIFKSVTGESVYHYIKRVRLERAAYFLWGTELPIKNIAGKCGFNSISNFSYNYKRHFGRSAMDQRELNEEVKSMGSYPDITVEVKVLPKMRLGYMKKIGEYDFNFKGLESKLLNWAHSRGENPDKMIVMGYDSIYVTKSEHLRSDLCIPISKDVEPNDDVNIMNFPEVKVISTKVKSQSQIHFIRDSLEFWIRNNGYLTIIGSPSLVLYHGIEGEVLDPDKVDIEICVPVRVE